MRIRTISILASTTLAALLGCPLENPSPPASQAATGDVAGSTGVSLDNGTGHDDAVDDVADSSWVEPSELASGSGALRVLLTDAPIAADNVFVTICNVSVHGHSETAASEPEGQADAGVAPRDRADAGAGPELAERAEARVSREVQADAGASERDERVEHDELSDDSVSSWYTVSDQCQRLDLLTLQQGVTEALGVASLPAGRYNQIRLVVSEASIVVDGVEQALDIPSGFTSGIKLQGHFDVVAGEATTLTLDFDAAESIHASGDGFVMRPVLRLLDAAKSHADGEQDAGGAGERGASAQPERGGARAGSSRAEGSRPSDDGAEAAEEAGGDTSSGSEVNDESGDESSASPESAGEPSEGATDESRSGHDEGSSSARGGKRHGGKSG